MVSAESSFFWDSTSFLRNQQMKKVIITKTSEIENTFWKACVNTVLTSVSSCGEMPGGIPPAARFSDVPAGSWLLSGSTPLLMWPESRLPNTLSPMVAPSD